MDAQKKRYWKTVGLFALVIVVGVVTTILGLERLDTAILKFRQIGRIAAAVGVTLIGVYMLYSHVTKSRRKTKSR